MIDHEHDEARYVSWDNVSACRIYKLDDVAVSSSVQGSSQRHRLARSGGKNKAVGGPSVGRN